MVIVGLILLGLCLGSFVNALVWRVREQSGQLKQKKADKAYSDKLSISKGRSMCPNCKHELKLIDLIPLLSWLSLKGKCRYCRKPISVQYPLVELATAGIFVASYLWWPETLSGLEIAAFVAWLGVLTGLMALFVYDVRWYLLPNRIMMPTGVLAGLYAAIQVAQADRPAQAVVALVSSVLIGGGLFYLLFQVSGGKWIGGGDVKLGALLGAVLGTPALSVLMIFLASFIGTLVSLPLLATRKLKPKSTIPFGPLLIIAAIIAQLFGQSIIDWYLGIFAPL